MILPGLIFPGIEETMMSNNAKIKFPVEDNSCRDSGFSARIHDDEFQRDQSLFDDGRSKSDRLISRKSDDIKKKDSILTELPLALKNKEIEIYYQPIVSMATNQPVCFEALLRWNHPVMGLIYPNDFIPIAEEHGLIKEIGEWVIKNSCRQLTKWQNEFPSEPPISVSVNVSPRQLEDQDLLHVVEQTLSDNDPDHGSLILEITESSIIRNTKMAGMIINSLRSMGVKIFLDDFGVGFSSLDVLRKFPFDSIKLDRSIVWRMSKSNKDMEVIRRIFELGLKLKKEIVAEGIETIDQQQELKEMHCKLGQGYLFAKPLTINSVDLMLKTPVSGNRCNFSLGTV